MKKIRNFISLAAASLLIASAGCGDVVPRESSVDTLAEVTSSSQTTAVTSAAKAVTTTAAVTTEKQIKTAVDPESANWQDNVRREETIVSPIDDGSNDTPSQPSAEIHTASEKLASMSLRDKVYQMFIVTPETLTGENLVTAAGPLTQAGLQDKKVGGIIYFARNLETVSQTASMISNSQSFSETGLFIAVDEEGGTVARCGGKLGTTNFSDMAYYGQNCDTAAAYNIGSTIGSDIAGIGFNVDFAPVADVDICEYNELGSRIFSSDPAVVSKMTAEVVRGLENSGVSATLKHFPGLGAGNGNTHNGSVVIDRSHDQLAATEFMAFKGGIDAGADFVMIGHQITTGSGDDLPGDLSYTVVTEWLRNELGFSGIAVTDAQAMGAIANNYSSAEAAMLSVQAGIDIILMPNNLDNAAQGIMNAVNSGQISEERINESLLRILSVKEKYGLI